MKHTIYNMKNIENDWDNVPNNFDCFIVAGGSDNRAYEILRKAIKREIQIKNVIFFNFVEREKSLDIDQKKVYYEYKKFNFNLIEIPCTIREPSSCIKSLSNYRIDFSKYTNVGLDISCFTKPYFFLLLKHLHTKHKLPNITVFYTEPQSYIFPKGLYFSYQSSIGPLKVLEVPGFTGSDLRGQQRLLVILLGFDGDLSREINEDVAPLDTIVVNGFPGYAPKFKDISLICNEKLINEKNTNICYCRANNPFEVYNFLQCLKNKYNDKFINIAPLGTKPMALGACLFALHYPEARIVYPMPEKYITDTTDRCWNSWAYNIPLFMNL